MKKRDLEKQLKKLGWSLQREGSSHEIWSNGTHTTTVPRHAEINEMTAKGILKQARGKTK